MSIGPRTPVSSSAAHVPQIPLGECPVLAQIPDVSLRPSRAGRPPGAAARTEYRFDAAESPTARPPYLAAGGGDRLDTRGATSWLRGEAASRVLPTTDPFSSPGESLQDRIVPLARFLMLVVLFTAACTSLLMLNTPSTPASTAEEATAASERPDTAPTALGPLGTAPPEMNFSARPAPAAAPPNFAQAPATVDQGALPSSRVQGLSWQESSAASAPYPTTDLPAVDVAAIDRAAFAAGEVEPAGARFTGHIQEPPLRQAQHGDHESSIH